MSNSNINLQTQSLNALHNAIMEAGSKDRPPMLAPVPVAEGSSETTTERYMENYKNVSQDIRDQLNAKAEAVQIILTGIDNDIYSTVDACPNACEMWKAIERLKQNVNQSMLQELETNLYGSFGKFTSRMCHVPNHSEWSILTSTTTRMEKNEVNEIRAERLARTGNPLHLFSTTNQLTIPQNHPTQNTQYSSTRSQQSTRNRGKAIVTSSAPTYDLEPATVTEDDEIINKELGYDNHEVVNVAGARENVGTLIVQKSRIQCYNCKEYGHVSRECQTPKRVKDAAYHKEKIINIIDTMAQIQEVTPDSVDNSDQSYDEPMHKVQNNNDNYNVFAMENEHPEQPESSNDIYLAEQGDTNITIDSLDICYDRVQDDHDDTDDLDQERDLLAS
ncbi:retrovirus-related pol polyprotein from transposon TNT 1-94 [Tanacetum coccineum]